MAVVAATGDGLPCESWLRTRTTCEHTPAFTVCGEVWKASRLPTPGMIVTFPWACVSPGAVAVTLTVPTALPRMKNEALPALAPSITLGVAVVHAASEKKARLAAGAACSPREVAALTRVSTPFASFT
jgi:hypothetical protein